MQTVSIVIGVMVLIFGVGYFVTNNTEEPAAVDTQSASKSDVEDDVNENSSVSSEATSNEVDTSQEATSEKTVSGIYTEYDADAIAQSNAEHILLFFKASWCPSCRALDADIIANTKDIPAGVEIYTVDYDTATDLKRQYGITTQHSIIEISSDGTLQSGITHGLTLDDVLSTI